MKKQDNCKKQTLTALQLLLKNEGVYINIRNFTITPKHSSKVFEQVIDMLKIMGMKYQNPSGTHKIRILTKEQAEAAYLAKNGVFSKRYGYSPPTLNGKKFNSVIVDEVYP